MFSYLLYTQTCPKRLFQSPLRSFIIRENQELIKKAAQKKRLEFDVEKLIAVDDKRRELLSAIENRRAEQNKVSEKIAKAVSDEERNALIGPMKSVKEVQNRP